MNKYLLGLLLVFVSVFANAQVASRLFLAQTVPTPSNVRNYLWVDNTPGLMNRIWTGDMDSMKVYIWQTPWFNDSTINLIAQQGYLLSLDTLSLSNRIDTKFNTVDTANKWLPISTVIPAAQVNSDWNATSGVSEILNKPSLFSGDYNDLSNKPTIPTNTNQLTNGAGFLTGVDTVNLSTVLATKISTEVDPNTPAYAKTLTAFSVIKSSTDPLYRPITYVPTWSDILSKPTFATVATSGSYADLTDKPKVSVTYSGTTNASGIYSVTFPTAYSVAPNIQVEIVAGTIKQDKVVNVSTTGFSVLVQLRNDVLGLLPTYSNVNGASVDVLITEK